MMLNLRYFFLQLKDSCHSNRSVEENVEPNDDFTFSFFSHYTFMPGLFFDMAKHVYSIYK